MPSTAGYEPLPQHVEEDEETVNGGDRDHIAKPSHQQALKRPFKPGHIDLSKLDSAFKRCGGRLLADLNLTFC
jgi:phosphatidylinositol 4-kinase type 2